MAHPNSGHEQAQVDDSEYSDAEEAVDVLIRAGGVIAILLERKQPQWIEAELRSTLNSITTVLSERLEMNWVH